MRRAGFTARTRRGVGTLDGRIDVGKPTTKGLIVPDIKFPPDGEWHPEHAALQQAAGTSSTLGDFYRERQEIEIEIRRYERRYQETREEIAKDDAVALAKRIKNLHLPPAIGAREDFIKFHAGRCLTLKEGQAADEVYAADARLEVVNPYVPEWRGAQWNVTLAIPAELQSHGPDATFGVQTFQWLDKRCETLVRELARCGPPGSPAYSMFDGGGFALVVDLNPPGPDVVPVVLAPDEDAIGEYIERTASSPDHWDALDLAARVLRQCGQLLGDTLTSWVVQRGKRPDGRKAAKAPANALRNHAIIKAVRALERCGIPPTRHRDKSSATGARRRNAAAEYPSGCAIAAKVFGTKATAVEHVLKAVRKL